MTKEEVEEVKNLLEYFGLPLFVENISVENIYEQLFLDKKVKENKIAREKIQNFLINTLDISSIYCNPNQY